MTETKRNPYSWRGRLFSPPHLPGHLTIFSLLLIVTNFYFVLIKQPIVYWLDYNYAVSSIPWVQQLLIVHPLVFFGIVTIYLLVISLALRKLPTFYALIFWMIISFIHLQDTISGLNLHRLAHLDEGAAYTIEVALFIVISGILGLALARAFPVNIPIADTSPNVPVLRSKFAHRAPVIFAIAWLLLLTASLVRAMYIPDVGWHPIASEINPPPRTEGEIAYDSNRRRAVLFGGGTWTDYEWEYKSDTWEWDGSNWEQRLPDKNPPGRIKHAIAYDPVRNITVLFGGIDTNGDLGDTWIWDGEQWEQQYPQTIPQARCCHNMVYDPQRGGIVLYGGVYGDDNFLYDAWQWDGAEWMPLALENQRGVGGYDLAYHEELNFIVAAQVWIWQDETWSRLRSNNEPKKRNHEGLVYDPMRKQMVLFGGIHEGESFDDTWVLEGQVWRKLDLFLSPSARRGHIMFYDLERESVVVFGGMDEMGISYNDMWELTLPVNE